MVQAMQIVSQKIFLWFQGWYDCFNGSCWRCRVISVIGQGFPKEFSEMIRLGLNRKVDEAFKIQYLLSDCIDMIFDKEILPE
jgi:hypothetical protein